MGGKAGGGLYAIAEKDFVKDSLPAEVDTVVRQRGAGQQWTRGGSGGGTGQVQKPGRQKRRGRDDESTEQLAIKGEGRASTGEGKGVGVEDDVCVRIDISRDFPAGISFERV